MSERISSIVSRQSPPFWNSRLFRIDVAEWAIFGMILICLAMIVIVGIVWHRDMNRQKDNERRMIELLESIDRRLAERDRGNQP